MGNRYTIDEWNLLGHQNPIVSITKGSPITSSKKENIEKDNEVTYCNCFGW